ncbi:hypothetical protein OSB04_005085 [Centaurea solstitialis]|uniref:Uncharacterized protein n=1 Tax=Centaurea solstitialis TaxID=347529 RepID=A0AA38WPD1_9ASTR|nr:hypothetical protein OSB04_005085 [Centaurea solstitialis]
MERGCEKGTGFSPSMCNNKLIGARSFSKGLRAARINISTEYDFDSARDFFGHGIHTSSTAAGSNVLGADHFGYAMGVVRGMAPSAHIAMYKVLWASDSPSSASSDILAGMDQAISDGVDIMSICIRFDQTPLFEDVIAIASLSAVEKGIVVVCVAGNDGPGSGSIYYGAPWIMTVGAGTIDRSNVATLELGNGLSFVGTSYFPVSVSISNRHLYYGSDDPKKVGCSILNPLEVKGKVVLCDNSNLDLNSQMDVVTSASAYAAIFLTESLFLDPKDYRIPRILLHTSYADAVKEYAMKGNTSTVKNMRFVVTETGTGPAPEVALFSSRGPDPITPSVLKPDLLAPGVGVLGSVRPDVAFMVGGKYDQVTDYALYSGTSMAAPHVTGVVALIKSVHCDWTPAAIRSALMTTATNTNNRNGIIEDQWSNLPATPLDFGAVHIDPNKAVDPGLIYDMCFEDYVDFLCGLGYTEEQMSATIRKSRWEKNFIRTISNVGDASSTYRATFEVPAGMTVSMEQYESKDFVLNVKMEKPSTDVKYGYLKWIDEHNHKVSSPIVVIGN